MTDLSSAAAWLLHAMEVHAWRACLAHGGDARAVRYTVGTWDRGVKTDYPEADVRQRPMRDRGVRNRMLGNWKGQPTAPAERDRPQPAAIHNLARPLPT